MALRSGPYASEAKAGNGGRAGVGPHLEGAKDFVAFAGLVAEPEDEDAGLDLFGGEQIEAAGLSAKLHLCSELGVVAGFSGEAWQGSLEGGFIGLVEGREPVVEQMAGWGVGDQAGLVAEAGQVHDDEGMDGAGCLVATGWAGSVGGIAEDDGVDLVGIILVCRGSCACGRRVAPAAPGEKFVPMLAVSEGVGNRREHGEGEHRGE